MKDVVIVSAVRTPVGRFGGSLIPVTDRKLSSLVIAEAMKRAGITPDKVEEVIFSQQYRTGELPANMARPVAVDAGVPIEVPQYTVAKACGGSLKTVFLAAQAIKAEDADLIVAGGVEHMSNAAYLLTKARWGYRLGHGQLMDQLVLYDPLSGNTMGETAENVAEKYQISREDQDAFALESQKRAANALEKGLFDEQIVPVPIPQRKGDPVLFSKDEHPRPDTTLEGLAKLKPVFRDGGSVTAGNSSGMNDGAAAIVVASRENADIMGLKPFGFNCGICVFRSRTLADGHRPHLFHPEASEKDGNVRRRHRCRRAERGVRLPEPRLHPGTRSGPVQSERERRRHSPRTPHQRNRRCNSDQADLRDETIRKRDRTRNDVPRRRAGRIAHYQERMISNPIFVQVLYRL